MSQPIPSPQPLQYEPSPLADSTIGRIVAWIVIVVSVVALWSANFAHSRAAAAPGALSSARVALPVEVLGRYIVGARLMVLQTGTAGGTDTTTQAMIPQLDNAAQSSADRLAVVTVVAEVQGAKRALDRIKHLKTTTTTPVTARDGPILTRIYTKGAKRLSDNERNQLVSDLGWFGRLALSFDQPDTDPVRAQVLAEAHQAMLSMVAGLGGLMFAMVAGIGLLIFLLIRLADGKLKRNYRPPRAGGGVFLEAFAIYLGGMTAMNFGLSALHAKISGGLASHIALMAIPTIVAIVWPLLRGVGGESWRAALGWHAGAGAIREIGLGIVGYIAGLPFIAGSFLITLMLMSLSGERPSHPIEQMFGGSTGLLAMVYLLASLYAPLTEETMFRGAFFNALRIRHGWTISAIVSAFLFAAIHPQGWTVIPALMAIAIVLAAIREWRGTILSSAAAHCLHNSMIVTFAILATR